MLYNNWNNTRMAFEACYQIVILTTFTGKLLFENWNKDKVRPRNGTPVHPIFLSLLLRSPADSMSVRSHGETLERLHQ